MSVTPKKTFSLEEIWPDLEKGLFQLISQLNQGLSEKQWMNLYT
jgi:hypothetical protein